MQVIQRRGALVETRHPVRAVAVRDGAIIWESGPPVSSPWRSAAKPLQLWCSLEALGDPDLPEVDIALGASSHAGQPDHVARLRALQARLGVPEDALRCGAEPPLHGPSWEAALRLGGEPEAITNDCSGKHTFFIAATRANRWPEDYRAPDHPLQRRIAAVAEAWTGEIPGLATDGCGVPVLGLTIDGMARAWAHIATAMADAGDPWREGGEAAPDLRRAARIGWAMARHPWWTSGDGRLDLDVAGGALVPMVGKIGAQGVFCLALPTERLGIAVKTLSGDEGALGVAVAEVLQRVAPDAWRLPSPWPWAEVRNVVGDLVGDRVAAPDRGVYSSDSPSPSRPHGGSP